MNIRNHRKKIFLSLTAFFWASCGGDSESTAPIPNGNSSNEDFPNIKPDDLDGTKIDTLYGIRPVYDIDSGSVSSSDICESSSSSEEVLFSSSEPAESSSSMFGPYKLASDTSVTCRNESYTKLENINEWNNNYTTREIDSLRNFLENNQTETIENLDDIEYQLDEGFKSLDCGAPVYGSLGIVIPHIITTYYCEDKKNYPFEHDSLVYSEEEYYKKFPQSSNSMDESSSSTPPSPLCQKKDFTTNSELNEKFFKNTKAIIDSVRSSGDSISANCLDEIIYFSLSRCDLGIVAQKQVCDGDTIVNPRYQKKLDSYEQYMKEEIKNCQGHKN